MKCTRCGAEVGEGVGFCPNCGTATQPGVIFSNTNPETGNTTAVSFGPNGIHTQVTTPVKNPKLALIVAILIVVMVVGGFGVGIWAMVQHSKDDTTNEPTVAAGKEDSGKTEANETGETVIDCNKQDGKNGIDMNYTFKDGVLDTLVYTLAIDENNPGTDEDLIMQITFMMMGLGMYAENDPGVTASEKSVSGGVQRLKYTLKPARMGQEAKQALLDGMETVKLKDVQGEIEAAAKEAGLSCATVNLK